MSIRWREGAKRERRRHLTKKEFLIAARRKAKGYDT